MRIDPGHLTSLFENATEGIVLTDRSGKIVLVNPAAQRMFGYKEEELIQHPIEELIPQRYQAHHKELRQEFYHDPQNREMGHGRDLYGKKKDGTDMPVEVSLSHYNKGEELFVIAFIIDITERKKIENNIKRQQKELEEMAGAMRKLNAQLEAKVEERTLILKEALKKLEESQEELSEALSKEKQLNEIKSRFVSMASHEFRTPLSTILSSATLVSKYQKTEEGEKRERHLKKIKDSVSHLNNLLEDFLSLGKLDEGRINADPHDFNLKEMINETLADIKVVLKPGQKFNMNFEGQEIINADKKLLRNILINLSSNAAKFSQEDSLIEIGVKSETEKTTITVKDHGIGISEKDQEHLFNMFYRAYNVTNIQGTGLGLHIVKRYLDLMNGTVNLQSKLGKGTTIIITFPNKSNE